MPDFELVIRDKEGNESRYPMGPRGLTVGRGQDADIVISDPLVSRVHAQFVPQGGGCVVRDLQSRNGILVNGAQVESAAIGEGDEVLVGDHYVYIERLGELSDSSTMLSFEEAHNIYESIISEGGAGRLPILYKAAQLLGTVFDLDDLLNKILDIIFEALPVRRGYVLTLREGSGDANVRASKTVETAGQELPLSKTLIRHVFIHQNAILTLNAQQDERFDGAASILGHHIQSAMCVPLCGREAVVGAIYVDSGTKSEPFTNDDLELLTAIGRVVGVAVENARLYAENVARERLAAIGEATAGLGHCIKNILTGMKGGGEFVDTAVQNKDWQWIERGWPMVKRAVNRIETLVLNLLTFSRDRKPDISPTNINDLAREVLEIVKSRAEKEGTKLILEAGDIGTAYCDGREMYRVLLNLVTNALDACEDKEGGVVTVTTWGGGSRGVYIKVQDNGVGIPPEVVSRLSEAFVSTKGSRGTGLGLACSYKIVREHHGEITVDSQPGAGAAFTVFLPQQTMSFAAPGTDAPATPAPK